MLELGEVGRVEPGGRHGDVSMKKGKAGSSLGGEIEGTDMES